MKNLPNLCTLINGINMDKRKNGYYYGYGKYGKYGKYGYGKKYGYGYGYGYGKDNKNVKKVKKRCIKLQVLQGKTVHFLPSF